MPLYVVIQKVWLPGKPQKDSGLHFHRCMRVVRHIPRPAALSMLVWTTARRLSWSSRRSTPIICIVSMAEVDNQGGIAPGKTHKKKIINTPNISSRLAESPGGGTECLQRGGTYWQQATGFRTRGSST